MPRTLALLLAAAPLACGNVEVDPITAGSASAAGSGGSTTATTSTSSSTASSTSSSSTTTGTGGALCADPFIALTVAGSTTQLTSNCGDSSPQSQGGSGPVGQFQMTEGPRLLVIVGCGGSSANPFPSFSLTLWGPSGPGKASGFSLVYEPSDTEFQSAVGESITANIDSLSDTEISGSTSAVVGMDGTMLPLQATFHVCRLPDSGLGPY